MLALIGALLLAFGAAQALAHAIPDTNKAPAISKQPSNVTATQGASATFTATATGTPTPTAQWQVSTNNGGSWSTISGATSSSYTIAAVNLSESGNEYRVTFTNELGSVTSNAVTLTVQTIPVVTTQPLAVNVEEGQNATFTAAASGIPAPTVQWEQSTDGGEKWTKISGQATDTLTLTAVKTAQSGNFYRATFINAAGSTPTEGAKLTVHVKPAVTKQPAADGVIEGQTATFEAAASGFPAPTVQWQVDTGSSWSNIEGATSATLTISDVPGSDNGYEYRAVFTNEAGTATTNAATLTVEIAPAITLQPLNQNVEEGHVATFTAEASGVPAPTVDWEQSLDGGEKWIRILSATSDTLNVTPKLSQSGNKYRAVFTNGAGTATTEAATLIVYIKPAVTKQPLSATVTAGESITFEAAGSGSPTPSVQWELSTNSGGSWAALSGATSDKLTIAETQVGENGWEYRASFTNVGGTATSSAATLTVHVPPTVTSQPESVNVEVGQTAVFEAAATGFPTPTVQWEVSTNSGTSWSTVEGATSDVLSVSDVQQSYADRLYRAAFTNAAGKVFSEPALLTVGPIYNTNAWGMNSFGQLGNDSGESFSDVPVAVRGLTDIESIAAGGDHSLALLDDGKVKAWGFNGHGQLGDGTTIDRLVPVEVDGLSSVTAIAAGADHSLALLSNGTVMAWGDNEEGQLGRGNFTENEEEPTIEPVKGLSSVTAIAAHGNLSMALLSNGTVMAWGENENGELGNGGFKTSNVPVAVKNLKEVTAIAAGGDFGMALERNGTVMAWGSDQYGQLSSKEQVEGDSTLPVRVEGLSGATAIAAGANHALALLSGGTVDAWGADADGQAGTGTAVREIAAPTPVSGLSGVSAISAGGNHSLALLASHTVEDWGDNERGILGDGTSGGFSDVPVAVEGLAGITGIAAGTGHSLTFGEPTPVVLAVTPSEGPSAGGTSVTITGLDFGSASAVDFAGTPATSYKVNSGYSITAVAPAGTGVVNITVTTPAGTSAPVHSDRFTYLLPPTVTKLSAKGGPVTGGTSITITGTHFEGVKSVHFGAVAARQFTVTSTTTITAVAPANVAGKLDVTVTNAGGTSATSKSDLFAYGAVVESIAPEVGAATGGETVTVTGTGFATGTNATVFSFGKKKATVSDCESSSVCTVTTPVGKAGTVDVTAKVAEVAGFVNAPYDHFTYE